MNKMILPEPLANKFVIVALEKIMELNNPKISTEIVNGLIHYKLISDGKIYNIILKDYLIFLKLGMEIYSYQINSISFNIKKNKVDYKIIYAKEKSSKLSLRKY